MEDLEILDLGDGWITVQCPYCFEQVEIYLERDVEGSLVQDCEVCCNPWQLEVRRGRDGLPSVDVDRL